MIKVHESDASTIDYYYSKGVDFIVHGEGYEEYWLALGRS